MMAIKKTNILYVETSSGFGGAICSLVDLISALDRSRYNPVIVLNHADPESIQLIEKIGAPFYIFGRSLCGNLRRRIVQRVNNPALRKLFVIINLFLEFFLNFFTWIKVFIIALRHKIDIVHFNNTINLEVLFLSFFLWHPKICHVRGGVWESKLTRFIATRCHIFVAVSHFIKSQCLAIGIPDQKTVVLYDGFCEKKYIQNKLLKFEKGIKIGIFSCLTEWKGHKVFLDAIQILKKTNFSRDLKFYIVGDTPSADKSYYNELKAYTTEKGIADVVVFSGYRSDVADFMKKMDIIVHTSVEPEPFGRVIIEGMAAARVVIATGIGGPLEIIEDGVDGFLIPPNDPIILAEKIVYLVEHKELRTIVGKKAHQTVNEKFSFNNYKEIDEIYENILGRV